MYKRKNKLANFSIGITALNALVPKARLPNMYEFLAAKKLRGIPLRATDTKEVLINQAKKLLLKPIDTFRLGKIADTDANILANNMGYTRKGITRRAMAGLLKNKPDEGVVALGGYFGSQIGKRAGGKPGEVAGDIAGSYLTRRSLEDARSAIPNGRRVLFSPAYKGYSPLRKAKLVVNRVANNAKSLHSANRSELPSDMIGWGIGTALGDTTSGIANLPSPLPAAAAITGAMSASPIIRQGVEELGKYPVDKVLKRTGRRLKARYSLKHQVKKGLDREKQAFNKLNTFLGLPNY